MVPVTGRRPIPQWLNALSLDAVAVAVAWHLLLDGDQTNGCQTITLALIVWLVYTADRWLDARRLSWGEPRMLRHDFAARHAHPIRLAWCLIAAVTLCLITTLPRQLITHSAALAGCVLIYALITHRTNIRAWRSIKPYVAGVLFALGVSLPLWFGITFATINDGLKIAMFASLCVFNCLIVSMFDRRQLRGVAINRTAVFLTATVSILLWVALVRAGGMTAVTYAAAGSIAALLIVRDMPLRTESKPTLIRWHPVSFWADLSLAVPAFIANTYP